MQRFYGGDWRMEHVLVLESSVGPPPLLYLPGKDPATNIPLAPHRHLVSTDGTPHRPVGPEEVARFLFFNSLPLLEKIGLLVPF